MSKKIEELDENFEVDQVDKDVRWFDARELEIKGRAFPGSASYYHRLPKHLEPIVREQVWELQQHSAGLQLYFSTDSNEISLRWEFMYDTANIAMPHMSATGKSGFDLYMKKDAKWSWCASSKPTQSSETVSLVKNIPPGNHDLILYFPLYNGVKELQLGIQKGAYLSQSNSHLNKAVCFYGTSIVQGGCASRPGLAYPAIISRRLQIDHFNLGFSGNAHWDLEIAEEIAKLDVGLFVLDAMPNNNATRTLERCPDFVRILRQKHPKTPILFIENIRYQDADLKTDVAASVQAKNQALKQCHDMLLQEGLEGLFYLNGRHLLGNDNEATVDGTHPNDLGFMRMADYIQPIIEDILSNGN